MRKKIINVLVVPKNEYDFTKQDVIDMLNRQKKRLPHNSLQFGVIDSVIKHTEKVYDEIKIKNLTKFKKSFTLTT